MTTLQQAVEQFTQSTEELLQAVNVRKLALDSRTSAIAPAARTITITVPQIRTSNNR